MKIEVSKLLNAIVDIKMQKNCTKDNCKSHKDCTDCCTDYMMLAIAKSIAEEIESEDKKNGNN